MALLLLHHGYRVRRFELLNPGFCSREQNFLTQVSLEAVVVQSEGMATQRFRGTDDVPAEDSRPWGVDGSSGEPSNDSDSTSASKLMEKLSMRERFNKDRANILLLLLLYVLQGIPIGLSASIPIILQEKKIGYRQQALFSLVTWPFTIKLLWAPIIDSIYSSRFGRRKSWLIPSQWGIGITMVTLSFFINGLMGENTSSAPNVVVLTVIFFFLHFLAATQDVAVDAWALTILSKENVGLQSTCNSVGQTAGYFTSYTFFLAFSSKEFCNRYLRSVPQDKGIIDIPAFLLYFGVVFLLVTTMVWWFKKEKKEEKESQAHRTILSGYMSLLSIIKLPAVQTYALAILTSKVAFAAADSVSGLKLVEAGLPSEQIALMALPMMPVQIILPLIISRFTAGPRPLDAYMKAYIPRVFMGVLFAAIVWWTGQFGKGGEFPFYYYVIVIVIFMFHQVCSYTQFVSIMAFNARMSDPVMGGTYMTLLNTFNNVAGTWSATLALWLVDNVSFKDCEGVSDLSLDCDTMQQLKSCEAAGGHCVTHLDGYYVEMAICIVCGLLWVLWHRRSISRMQNPSEWKTPL